MSRVRVNGTLEKLVDEIFEGIDSKEILMEDIYKWRGVDLGELPAFNEDGSVALYEVGNILLGKTSLIRFFERIKDGDSNL